jgi:hypothetical protein
MVDFMQTSMKITYIKLNFDELYVMLNVQISYQI